MNYQSLLGINSGLSVKQTGFHFDGQPMDEKGISKQLEMEEEDITESFHSLVSF